MPDPCDFGVSAGRQQRLEQLYRQERLQHEMELQGLGLALMKQQH
jgi:hypothetical protein